MKRIEELDGVRGIAILLVLVWHYVACQLTEGASASVDAVRSVLSLTWSGVDLFFVLSGFLIVGILLDARGSERYFRVFYLRRVCRILPLYFALVIGFVFLTRTGLYRNHWLFFDPYPIASYLTFTQNFLMAENGFGPHWLGVTWSLAVEEQFYVVVPVLVAVLSRRSLTALLAVGVIAAPIFRWQMDGHHAYVLPLARADAIFIGALIAVAVRSDWFPKLVTRHRAALRLTLLLFLGGYVALSLTGAKTGGVLVHSWLAGLYALVLLAALNEQDTPLGRLLRNRWLKWFGLRSYGIYLLHQPVSGIVHDLLAAQPYPMLQGVMGTTATVVSLVVLVALAELSFRYFESPFLRLGASYRLRRATPDPSWPLAANER